MKKILKNMSIFLLVLLGLGYVAAAGFLYLNQTKLMYFPSPETPQEKSWKVIYAENTPQGTPVVLGYQFESISSPDNALKIAKNQTSHLPSLATPINKGFGQKKEKNLVSSTNQPVSLMPEPQTVLLFHGNAGSAAHRVYYQKIFPANTTIIVAEYPGFGANFKEQIGKDALLERARSLTHKVLKEHKNVVIVGESLGTGIAAQLAQENNISKMVLFTPYSSISEVASYRYPWMPVSFLLKDNYDTLASVSKYAGNTLVVLSEQDKTIPIEFGKKVFDTIKSAKTEILVKNAGHSTWWVNMSEEQKDKFSNFLRS